MAEEVTQVVHPDEARWEEEANGDRPEQRASLLDSLRAKRVEFTGDHFYDMEVPGYDGCLVLRLGPLRGQELSTLARRAESSKAPDREFNANCDIVIRACREVLGREKRDQELRTVHPDGETPVTFGEEFAEMFGLEANGARELLKELWNMVPSPEIAIGLQAAEYVQWSSEATSSETEQFAGE